MTLIKSFSLKQVHALLQSPWILLTALTVGIIIGIEVPELGQKIAPVGNLYLSLLKMCVLPILISGIVLSIARLMFQSNSGIYVQQILLTFLVILSIVSIGGLIVGLILEPGSQLDNHTLRDLGILINNTSVELEIPLRGTIQIEENNSTLATFLFNLVPQNIFRALAQGQILQILFFTIIFGISLGLLHREQEIAEPLFKVLDNIYKSFNKIIAWLMIFLPVGLLSLVAAQISQSGLDVIKIMAKFCFCSVLVFFLLYVLGIVVLSKTLQYPWRKVLAALREPTIIALVTNSSLAAMPVAITTLKDSLKCDPDASNIILPLAITLGRFGEVTYFIIASLFVIQVYEITPTPQVILVVLLGSIFAGIASSGSTGIIALSSLNIVFNPLGLPLEAVLTLFIVIDPFIDPLRTLLTLQTAVVATNVIANSSSALLTSKKNYFSLFRSK